MAKVLKQTSFMVIFNKLVGLLDVNCGLSYVGLNPTQVTMQYEGLIFNQKELAKFIKTYTGEGITVYEGMAIQVIPSGVDGVDLTINIDRALKDHIVSLFNKMENIDSLYMHNEDDITDEIIPRLCLMKKADGAIAYKYKNRYFMTLFPSLLPISKTDRVILSIYDTRNNNIFYAKFDIKKANGVTLRIYLAFINTITW